MKTAFAASLFVVLVSTFRPILSYPIQFENALNVRHFHMIQRGENGEIASRSLVNTFDLIERNEYGNLERRRCTTINACGTAGGCMVMAGQRYCDGVPWQKSFQDAVKQTGANGMTGLKIMAEGIGRGPVGMLVGAVKATTKALIDAKKEDKKHAPKKEDKKHKKEVKKLEKKLKKEEKKLKKEEKKNKHGKNKRELVEEEILNRRDFEVVERDENLDLVERGEYSLFDLVTRDEDGSIVTRSCEMYNGNISCL